MAQYPGNPFGAATAFYAEYGKDATDSPSMRAAGNPQLTFMNYASTFLCNPEG
jgi:hypothetical protein